ncbi:MAG TPA: G1 family glutamic endopeptidase [Candidatus Acidoferrales bacterium]|nr:G1 family glutamic endopeptidase [Candidatus Acidoferrales bacterium]
MQRPRKKLRTNAIFLSALWIALLLASLTILSSVVTPFLKSIQTETLVSLDWAGYAVASSNLFPQPQVVSVNGSWVIPRINPSAVDTFSAVWIGIGGQADTTLIQAGSEQDSLDGKAIYSLWYELLPENSITLNNITASPGDQISAIISLLDSKTNNWQISIADLTTGACFTQNCYDQNFNYNSSRLTAEWIVERPTVNNQISVLADFGSVTFTGIYAKIGNTIGTVNAFSNYQVLMQDRQNNPLVSVSGLNKAGTSFTVRYG